MIAAIVCLVLAAVLGVCMLFWPKFLWKIENFLWTKNGEPSDFYLAMTRLVGTLLLVAVIVITLIATLLHFDWL